MKPTILVVDDDEEILFAFGQVLRKEGYRYIVAGNGEEALIQLQQNSPDVVFMDITMPKLDGLQALGRIRQLNQRVPVVIVTGFGTMETAIRAMQLGAFEYLTKPLNVEKIRECARQALASVRKSNESHAQEVQISTPETGNRYALVGKSAPMQELYKLIGSISTTPNHTSVLITGESGTGKELVAHSIHRHSANNAEPFIAIDCSVFPENLLESELFGHEKGAFTGATDRKIGKFEIAGNGSIFLDEIGNLSPRLQQKLLRVLQEREMERIGGNQRIQVNARFMSATNSNIAEDVKEGKFREDLYYRLNVVGVQLPPLRERRDDIPGLAAHFLDRYSRQLHKYVNGFSEEAMALLQSYPYPGNVRELENAIEQAVMLAKSDVILPEDLQGIFRCDITRTTRLPLVSPIFSIARDHILNLFEKQYLLEQLSRHHGNVTVAAQSANMTRQNFQRLMRKHFLRSEDFRI